MRDYIFEILAIIFLLFAICVSYLSSMLVSIRTINAKEEIEKNPENYSFYVDEKPPAYL